MIHKYLFTTLFQYEPSLFNNKIVQAMLDLKKLKNRQGELNKQLEKIKSINELQNVLKVSTDQNKKLANEVKELKDKVETIIANHKQILDNKTTKPYPEKDGPIFNEIMELKKQLKAKYSKMKQLKEDINSQNRSKIEQAEFNKRNNLNTIQRTEREIQDLTKELKDLQAISKNLEKTMDQNKKIENVNQPRIEVLEEENKSLRAKIAGMRKYDYQKQGESIAVQTNLIANRKKMKEIEARKSMFDLKKMSVPDKAHLLDPVLIDELRKEVATLKKQVGLVGEAKTNEQAQLKKRRNEIYSKNKNMVKKMKEIELQKCKIEQQSNLWRKKWSDICKAVEIHSKKIKKMSAETQISQFVDSYPLRRDYAGIINRHRYEDRLILREEKTTKIIGMLIHETDRGIVAIQALYSNGERTYLPIPQHFIQRCKSTKIECSEGDFFKLFKIKYNSLDNKIIKVEIRSNKNIKYQFGDKKQWTDLSDGDSIYGFDIGINEYPVCTFGSYSHHKGFWLLEGFGVEINEIYL